MKEVFEIGYLYEVRTVCSNCGQQLTVGTEKFCPNCGQDWKIGGAVSVSRNPSVSIGNTQGDVMGVGFSGRQHHW